MQQLSELISSYSNPGRIEWIGIRPERRAEMRVLQAAVLTQNGLEGDHYSSGGKRSITLLQHEHLAAIGAFLGAGLVDPKNLRRNIIISGFNILGLKNRQFSLGTAILETTGICAPCSRMEETLGKGGYAAVRGHGGITARVITQGTIEPGDQLLPIRE